MTQTDLRYSYGPVPSRRLGKSLGINNIPAKVCTYSCIYCQVGGTTRMQVDRRRFYDPELIADDVRSRIAQAKAAAERIDYLTFVPDGEPTLDENLGKEVTLLKESKVPIGVITNSSLLWRDDVREELARADWVSVKVDAVLEPIWRQINRPHKALNFSSILEGTAEFARGFNGTLVTETMLVRGVNDSAEHIREIAAYLHTLKPQTAYLSIPIRPPAEKWVRSPDEETLNRAYQTVSGEVKQVEYLIGYEGNAFAFTGDIEKDLLSITAVHPMRTEAVDALLSRAGSSWDVVKRLVAHGELAETKYDGHSFYLRRFAATSTDTE
ncbi:MAG TPA: radical SAM protein [Bacteroidota bacterium]|nr:radical SAM protein [Bacteroidota bacterium]